MRRLLVLPALLLAGLALAPTPAFAQALDLIVRNGRVVDFEFTTVERTDSTFVMTPRPKGVKSDSFPLKEVSNGRATWENLEHDFPQRIIYRRGIDGSLIARIEGTTHAGERHVEWTMHPCEAR